MTQQVLTISPDQTLSTTELTAREAFNRGRTRTNLAQCMEKRK
jgi:hypothetical protein